jgi:hypothetical protein
MYSLGVILVGLGITLFIPSVALLVMGQWPGDAIPAFICGGVIAFPMIALGVHLIRKAERRQHVTIPPEQTTPGVDEKAAGDSLARGLDRLRGFDLSRLNVVGWLLLLATFAVVVVEAWGVVWLAGAGPGRQWLARVSTLSVLLVAIGFFFAVRWLLGKLGVTIYLPEEAPERKDAEKSAAGGGGSQPPCLQ